MRKFSAQMLQKWSLGKNEPGNEGRLYRNGEKRIIDAKKYSIVFPQILLISTVLDHTELYTKSE